MDKPTIASRKARTSGRSETTNRNRKERGAMKAPNWYPFPTICPMTAKELKRIEKQYWDEFPEALI
jgi:hypothetical protein